MALTDKLTAIADAIRGKTGKSDSMTLDQMPTEIAGIVTGGGGANVLTYTAAETLSGTGIIIEIEHGLGKIPKSFYAINETFLSVFGTETTHHTWFWAAGSNYNHRIYSTSTTQLGASSSQTLGIADTTAYCYADAEKIYLRFHDWRGICAGETIAVYLSE